MISINRKWGILAIVIGLLLICVSKYIKVKLGEAEGEISSAKRTVEEGNELFSLNPVSKEIGKGLTSGAKRKISAAEGKVAHYHEVALWCQYSGIGLSVIGILLFILGKKR